MLVAMTANMYCPGEFSELKCSVLDKIPLLSIKNGNSSVALTILYSKLASLGSKHAFNSRGCMADTLKNSLVFSDKTNMNDD